MAAYHTYQTTVNFTQRWQSKNCLGLQQARANPEPAHIMRVYVCVCMLRLIHYIVATIAAESPARIIAAVLYPHYTTSQHITQNNQT